MSTPPADGGPPRPADEDDGPVAPGVDDPAVPETDIEIEAHFHFGMTGSFPLRLGDLFFSDGGLYVVEYGYITPFVGLTARKHRREAAGMQQLVDQHGIDAAILVADSVVWHGYDNVERLVVHEGGRLGRPKLAVYPEAGPSHAYRFHDNVAFQDGLADLESVARRHGLRVDERGGLGFTPLESLRRFFWRP